ncbi:M3 family oligoendopeptidase [Desulforhopalus vacuolatus]|uniref:M3 family oligoendopeptidase n=1 Tax=Desulforhopalus vacuolatus TaxID=40414 RepID=UPI00196466CF|nr:M3 family oligoendopeptidase [Desulforhopalus vacuolatus]MBM9520016.1 M3 family oligoendopeptidase [Desulforhopalus vacuolatus]
MTVEKSIGCEKTFWNLTDLYAAPDAPAVSTDMEWCRKEAEVIHKEHSQQVAKLDAASLASLVRRLEQLDCRILKLETYAFLNHCTQLDNAGAGALEQKVREMAATCGTQTIFFALEWNKLEKAYCDTLLADPALTSYRHYLTAQRRYQTHLLSEVEEKLLLEKSPVGRESWISLFDKVLSGLKFGEKGRLEEEVLTDLYSPDREVRESAAKEMTEGLQANLHILTHIFNTLAADKMISDRLRRYGNWISSMNLHNDLHDSTVDVLVETVTSRYDLVERYYNLKRDTLKLPQLEDYDRYAPLPSLPSRKISWQECQKMVLRSFSEFSPEMAEIAGQFFEKQWIHAPGMRGKQGGAFAHPCVPEVHPYVLVNYNGTLNDVSTVAHELGHGVHQVLAAQAGFYNSDTPLPLAETASVFAELLVFNSQLALLENPAEQHAFICQKLESIFATVFRQTAMNRFENAMHNGRRKKGELSSEQLSAYWLETQQAMFGNSVHLRKDYGIWWSYIPHFLSTPGYVYSYAFGELLVLALYGIYQKEGESFVAKYLQLLASGGSQSPYDLMKPFGIDLNSADFWKQGLRVIEEMLERIE